MTIPSPSVSESDSIGDTQIIIELEGEGIRSGGSPGREGVWGTTGPVPGKCSLFKVSMSLRFLLAGEDSPWFPSRRRQMNTPRRTRKILRTTQATIPPIAPPLNLQVKDLGSDTTEWASFALTMMAMMGWVEGHYGFYKWQTAPSIP